MVFTSRLPDIDIPQGMTITQFMLDCARQHGNKVMTKDGVSGRAITFAQFVALVPRVAKNLANVHHFGKGDVLAILCPNLPEFPVIFHGIAACGATITTINPLYTPAEVAKQLTDCNAKAVFTVIPFMDKAKEAAQVAGLPVKLFVIADRETAVPAVEGLEVHRADSLMVPNDGPDVHLDVNPDEDVVVLPYSSGTTALPKGVMLTHANLIANIHQILPLEPFNSEDVLIGILPFFHIYAMMVVGMCAVARGCSVVVMMRFDLEQFLKIIQEEKITRLHIVPPICLALAKHPLVDKYDLSSVKVILSGAAPLSAELTNAITARFPWMTVKQGYGMTELSPVSHIMPEGQTKPGTVGWLAPNTEAKLIDVSTGEEITELGKEGELCIRGPQVMKGYLGKPEETANCIKDGWMHTGDVATVDEDGFFAIVDRVKELIKYKGFQVAPAELEGILLSHPQIADAAVIGSPDVEAGELPKAFVVKRPGSELTEAEVEEFVKPRVAHFKWIRKVEFVNEIPKSASGKILRRVLVMREREALAAAGSGSS